MCVSEHVYICVYMCVYECVCVCVSCGDASASGLTCACWPPPPPPCAQMCRFTDSKAGTVVKGPVKWSPDALTIGFGLGSVLPAVSVPVQQWPAPSADFPGMHDWVISHHRVWKMPEGATAPSAPS
jgi:hypothetical protein